MMTNNILFLVVATLMGCIGGIIFTYLFPFRKWQKNLDERIEKQINILLKEQVEKQVREAISRHRRQCPIVIETSYDRFVKLEERQAALYFFVMTNYPEFLRLLKAQFDTPLTKTEENVCILIKLGLNNQQIAQALSVEKTTLTKTRGRIRQKMKQDPGSQQFHRWLQQLGEPLGELPSGYLIYGSRGEVKLTTNEEEQNK